MEMIIEKASKFHLLHKQVYCMYTYIYGIVDVVLYCCLFTPISHPKICTTISYERNSSWKILVCYTDNVDT